MSLKDTWKRNHWIDHTRLVVVELFYVEYYIVTLKCGLEVTARSLKVVTFESLGVKKLRRYVKTFSSDTGT